jgi:hypothetical protein
MGASVSEVLVHDIFPAEVLEVGGRIWTGCRVFVTTERMTVWRQPKGHALEKVLDVALTEPVDPELRSPIEIATLTRGYLVNKGRGCGCHKMSLKALTPPAPRESTAQ